MIKVRLLKDRGNQVYRLIDSVDLPELESLTELNGLAVGIGKLLGKYQELVNDKSILASLVDTSVDDWTITDLESLQAVLESNQLRLVITDETQEDAPVTKGDVMYLLIDSSVKILGVIPTSNYAVAEDRHAPDIIKIVRQLVTQDYFNKNKFSTKILDDIYSMLIESKNLIGVYDNYSLNKLFRLLSTFNKELITVVIE